MTSDLVASADTSFQSANVHSFSGFWLH